ncbi:ABC transporter ATP-binding protein [Bdellovibrionota bacterium FG-1]
MSSNPSEFIEQDEVHDLSDQPHLKSNSFWRLARVIGRHRLLLGIGVVLMFLGTFATLLEPRIFGYAIDEAIVPKRGELLMRLSGLFFLMVLVRILAMIGQTFVFEVLGQRVTQELRVQLFSTLMRLPLGLYDKYPAGRLLTRVTNDIGSIGEMFSAGFVSMLSNALMVVGILIWLVVLDVKLGMIAASVFPFLVIFGVYFTQLLRRSYRESRSKLSALNAFLAENLSGMRVVHLFNRQNLHLERFRRINQWYTDALISTIRVYAFFQPAITIASGISVALLMLFGAQSVSNGVIKVGVLVAFFSYSISLFQPVREIADKWNVFLSGMISVERIFAILDWPTEVAWSNPIDPGTPPENSEETLPYENLRGHIIFEGVWFAYDDKRGETRGEAHSELRWVLKDFNLEILPGVRVGVVGHTGAGKTTLISLLMRFYEPQRGRILLDGKDLRDYDKRRLRASIGMIQQDAFVFSGTLKDNITFWRDDSGAGVMAARKALARLGYEKWWNTSTGLVQERGTNLSMGEKQVLAFSRALAANPRIWILDEATANMDSQTEESLQISLDEESRGRTSILIAHRLATVKTADLILVLHKGTLQEKGSHDELLQAGGLYARLYRYQEAVQGET